MNECAYFVLWPIHSLLKAFQPSPLWWHLVSKNMLSSLNLQLDMNCFTMIAHSIGLNWQLLFNITWLFCVILGRCGALNIYFWGWKRWFCVFWLLNDFKKYTFVVWTCAPEYLKNIFAKNIQCRKAQDAKRNVNISTVTCPEEDWLWSRAKQLCQSLSPLQWGERDHYKVSI